MAKEFNVNGVENLHVNFIHARRVTLPPSQREIINIGGLEGWDMESQPQDQGSQAMGLGTVHFLGIRLYHFCGTRGQNLDA